MNRLTQVNKNVAAVLVFGRPVLAFGAFACALWVMFTHNPLAYVLGISLLVLALAFDWLDGWFAVRYIPNSRLGPLADRMVDRIVLTIIFPVLGAGMLWRVNRLSDTAQARLQLLHAVFVLAVCVLVLMRDQFAAFLRSIAERASEEVEWEELTRLRTLLAFPLAVLLYAYAFYLPTVGWERLYRALDWIDSLPLRVWLVIEILFLVINIVSMTQYLRKYGPMALDDVSGGDELLRRRILSVIPNALTLMNGTLGITAVVFASHDRVREAVFVLMGAALFDRLDGLAARRLGLHKPLPESVQPPPGVKLGALLDDVSDGISFCFAPAVIFGMVMAELSPEYAPWLIGAGVVYGVAGVCRLIYFTLDKTPIPGFFKGMPVPAAAILVMAALEIAFTFSRNDPALVAPLAVFATAVLLLAAGVMNLYPVRYLHVGRLMGRRPSLLWGSMVAALVLVFTPYFGAALLAVGVAYVLSPLYTTGRIDPSHAAQEQRMPRAQRASR